LLLAVAELEVIYQEVVVLGVIEILIILKLQAAVQHPKRRCCSKLA
jgi:hypothetical protein